MEVNDREFHSARASEEIELARQTRDVRAKSAHVQLAGLHRQRAGGLSTEAKNG